MSNKEVKINGYKLLVSKISPLAPKAVELQYKKANPEPIAPTYSVEGAGVVTEFEHTPETVETKEEKEALLAYNIAKDEWTSGLTYKLLRLFLSQGVKLKLTKKQEQHFAVQLSLIELDVPENEVERDLLYLETFIIADEESMQEVIESVLGETGINEEKLASANETFRN